MLRLFACRCVLLGVVLLFGTSSVFAAPFEDKVLPFLKTYCVQCHNKDKASAELDLTKFDSTAKIVQDSVREMRTFRIFFPVLASLVSKFSCGI